MLDRQFADILPLAWQEIWFHYLPAGELNARLDLSYDGRAWTPRLEIQCVDVSFSHYKFPYRLERAAGTLSVADDRLAFRLRGYGDGQPVDLEGQIEHPGPKGVGLVTVNAAQMPLTEKLFDALPGKTQKIVRSLAPQGTFNTQVRLWRRTATEKWHHQAPVDLNRISLKYEKFPYPLAEVRGRLEGVDGQWQFRDLVGTNNGGYVTCGGQFLPSPGGGELVLRFNGSDVPLSDELRGGFVPPVAGLVAPIETARHDRPQQPDSLYCPNKKTGSGGPRRHGQRRPGRGTGFFSLPHGKTSRLARLSRRPGRTAESDR